MSLQSKYRNEKEGKTIIENDELFYSYQIVENEFHIMEVYIREDLRGNSKKYFDQILEKTKTFPNIKYAVGYIHTDIIDSERSMIALIKYGFKLLKTEGQNKIVLLKELI